MADKTTFFETATIDYFLRPGATAPTRPTAINVGLASAASDTEAGTLTELSYSGYTRQAAGFGASVNNGGAQRTSNAGVIEFPAIVGGPISASHWVIFDQASNA